MELSEVLDCLESTGQTIDKTKFFEEERDSAIHGFLVLLMHENSGTSLINVRTALKNMTVEEQSKLMSCFTSPVEMAHFLVRMDSWIRLILSRLNTQGVS